VDSERGGGRVEAVFLGDSPALSATERLQDGVTVEYQIVLSRQGVADQRLVQTPPQGIVASNGVGLRPDHHTRGARRSRTIIQVRISREEGDRRRYGNGEAQDPTFATL
jgi:hypothetical protein